MQQHVHDSNISFHENASVRTTALFCEKELKNCTPTDDPGKEPEKSKAEENSRLFIESDLYKYF